MNFLIPDEMFLYCFHFFVFFLFKLSFVFYGEAFEFEPVFSVWNFTFQWFDIGLTFLIPCLAMELESELVDLSNLQKLGYLYCVKN